MGLSIANIETGGLFEGIGQLAKDLREAITGDISAEKKAELIDKFQSLQVQLQLAQMEIDKIEAASGSLFRGGWRPAAGWCGVIGLFYQFLAQPIFSWGSLNLNWHAPPAIDGTVLLNLLMALLGLGGMRTLERINRVAKE